MEPPGARSFKDASPWEIRAALIPEEQPDFDRQWRKAMAEAADSLDLADVFRVLDSWRRHAMATRTSATPATEACSLERKWPSEPASRRQTRSR